MAVNSSSSSSSSNRLPLNMHCFVTAPMSFVFVTFNVANILLLLPLCVSVLHHGLQQMRKRSSSSSSPAASMSHADVFVYHMVAMELVRVLGCVLCCCGVFVAGTDMLLAGTLLLFFTWYGQLFFHVLTCVERHLAVVHPLAYRNLRSERGARIRNISIGSAWLLSTVKMSLLVFEEVAVVVDLCLFVAALVLVSFCSLSALRVLIRPGPGERGGTRERADQSKRRAFCTIVAILAGLVLRFTGSVGWAVLHVVGGRGYCVMVVCEIWINLSNSLLLPSLFLYRERKVGAGVQ